MRSKEGTKKEAKEKEACQSGGTSRRRHSKVQTATHSLIYVVEVIARPQGNCQFMACAACTSRNEKFSHTSELLMDQYAGEELWQRKSRCVRTAQRVKPQTQLDVRKKLCNKWAKSGTDRAPALVI
uniref:Uncharacterized protein n=1 Tax=Vespula pensylvanica TaxID=30213 RepID=A0A834UAD6_VESPE|nr:hypothetical protein H0235_008043 [Vespula pensylvanica]